MNYLSFQFVVVSFCGLLLIYCVNGQTIRSNPEQQKLLSPAALDVLESPGNHSTTVTNFVHGDAVILRNEGQMLPTHEHQSAVVLRNEGEILTTHEPHSLTKGSTSHTLNGFITYPSPGFSETVPTPNPVHSELTTKTFTTSVTSTTLASTKPLNNTDNTCPSMTANMDHLTQEEFIGKLTDSCRYDRLIRPSTKEPLEVTMQIDLMHIESSTELLQFKSFILVQLSYKDHRLKYEEFSPNRSRILGEGVLREKIWVPHLMVQNERESALMGPDGKDVFVQISPSGQVVYSYRIKVTFYCWMNLKKFPFDYQTCSITWVSWSYDSKNLDLEWETNNPYQVARNLHLTEFVLESKWTETCLIPKPLSGGLEGNYSACTFKFKLRREVGYYIMDYFLPSMMLVAASWVSFWLQADAGPPRVILGSSTMLSFITLNSGLSKNLPKVSYIKASEIWFLGCSLFIFMSLAEFAFVNVIWRRKLR